MTSKAESNDAPLCPVCGLEGRVLPIRYGFGPALTPRHRTLPDRKGVSGGKCSLEAEDPLWFCTGCAHAFDRRGDHEPWKSHFGAAR